MEVNEYERWSKKKTLQGCWKILFVEGDSTRSEENHNINSPPSMSRFLKKLLTARSKVPTGRKLNVPLAVGCLRLMMLSSNF
jgi:hypothetical protein